MKQIVIALSVVLGVVSCQQSQAPMDTLTQSESQPQTETNPRTMGNSLSPEKLKTITYAFVEPRQWLEEHAKESVHQQIAFAINRTDKANFLRMDSVLIPNDFSHDLANYLPFPLTASFINDIDKLIYFSYPTQTFAAYEKGILIRTGPTNMGSEMHQTPTGLFFTNWKARVSTSTVNSSWILNWNVNLMNKQGVGWHQYSLPGSPVSHACLRLQEMDAQFLYNWAEQWVLSDQFNILTEGTPVIIFGEYDFDAPKPWLQLISDPHFLGISEDELQRITQPFFTEIRAAQQKKTDIIQ